jgi:hypothetical protein
VTRTVARAVIMATKRKSVIRSILVIEVVVEEVSGDLRLIVVLFALDLCIEVVEGVIHCSNISGTVKIDQEVYLISFTVVMWGYL